jgi:hypothetical protein
MPPIVVVTILISVMVLITIVISNVLYKIHPKLIFAFPAVNLILAAWSMVTARATNDLGALGFVVFAFVFFFAFVVSLVYALVKYAKIGQTQE